MNWYFEVLKKYVAFYGRARRTEFWMFVLINTIIGIVLSTLVAVTNRFGLFVAIQYLYSLAVLLPGLGVTVRRLHDTGKSGWFILLGLIPLVGEIILIVFCAQDSQPGANTYGENPKVIANA
jgi:Predicted membrane protein